VPADYETRDMAESRESTKCHLGEARGANIVVQIPLIRYLVYPEHDTLNLGCGTCHDKWTHVSQHALWTPLHCEDTLKICDSRCQLQGYVEVPILHSMQWCMQVIL
jgi:hypothetical protein